MIAPPVNGMINFTQLLKDADGDGIEVLSVELDATDDVTQNGGARTPAWLDWEEGDFLVNTETGISTQQIDFTLPLADLIAGLAVGQSRKYTFKVRFQDLDGNGNPFDSHDPVSCTFDHTVSVQA